MYLDVTRAFYAALGHRRVSYRTLYYVGAQYSCLGRPCTKIGERLDSKQTARGQPLQNSVFGGDPMVLGGVLVIGRGNVGVTLACQESFGKPLPLARIKAAIRALPRPVTWP